MTITIEEAKGFITDVREDTLRKDWLIAADHSWNEIKKRSKNNKLLGNSANSTKKRAKHPTWWSIFKIRQSLVLSRLGIPIGKDTTQDGTDNIGATAAICIEKLAIGVAKANPNFIGTFLANRDDFLATDFAICRAFYQCEEVTEKVKEYLQPQQLPGQEGSNDPNSMVFVDSRGKVVESDEMLQDDEGFYIEKNETIDIDDEKIILKKVLYNKFYCEPDITEWDECERCAFENKYSEPYFVKIFGKKALNSLPKGEDTRRDPDAPKRKDITVFEYWDKNTKECVWFPDNGSDFIKPLKFLTPDDEDNDYFDEDSDRNGLYDLEKFFPVPECGPLITNAATDEFYPVPEYHQLQDICEDIHTIFARMIAATRALRIRLLFDNNIDGLEAAINEAADNDAFGVPNLTQALAAAGGQLANVLQYLPVADIIASLAQLYQGLEQRLNTVYKLTGTSDLLQGFVTDQTDRTFGERQLQEKYSLNQIEERQRKMAEYVRACYQLIVEMAIKNFKDSSLDMYIMPQTLSAEHQQRYKAAIGMLRENPKRFRVELETDSTIALNEEYDKKMRLELVNTMTTAIEKVANIGQSSPGLLKIELHALKYLIQGFRQSKMFQSEVTEAIDAVIQAADQAAQNQPPKFDKDQAMAKIAADKNQADAQLRQAKIQSDERVAQAEIQSKEAITQITLQQEAGLEAAKLAASQRIEGIKAQIASFKTNFEANRSNAELQLEYSKLNSAFSEANEQMSIARDNLYVQLRKVVGEEEAKQFKNQIDAQMAQYEIQIGQAQQSLLSYKVALDERDRMAQESRLDDEQELEEDRHKLEILKTVGELSKPEPEPPPVVPPAPNVTMNLNLPKAPKPKAPKVKK